MHYCVREASCNRLSGKIAREPFVCAPPGKLRLDDRAPGDFHNASGRLQFGRGEQRFAAAGAVALVFLPGAHRRLDQRLSARILEHLLALFARARPRFPGVRGHAYKSSKSYMRPRYSSAMNGNVPHQPAPGSVDGPGTGAHKRRPGTILCRAKTSKNREEKMRRTTLNEFSFSTDRNYVGMILLKQSALPLAKNALRARASRASMPQRRLVGLPGNFKLMDIKAFRCQPPQQVLVGFCIDLRRS